MFIKTQRGDLINLDHVVCIKREAIQDEYAIRAVMTYGTVVIGRYSNKAKRDTMYDIMAECIAKGDPVISFEEKPKVTAGYHRRPHHGI